MMAWYVSLGNVLARASASPVASGCAADPDYPLSFLGDGSPDNAARFLFETDGGYGATLDTNVLTLSSERADAPNGCADLLLTLAVTPGISGNPCDVGTYESRTGTYRFFRPEFWDFEVYPGQTVKVLAGLRLPAGTAATATKLRLQDLGTGKVWRQSTGEWGDDGDVGESTADSWTDLDVSTDPYSGTERTTFRLIAYPVAASHGPTTYSYVSDPCVIVDQQVVALVGHNIPDDATVTWAATGGPTWTLPTGSPTRWYQAPAAVLHRHWTLTITIPAGLIALTRAPQIGEMWAGPLHSMACPNWNLEVDEQDLGQVRVASSSGRISGWSTTKRAPRQLTLRFAPGVSWAELEDVRGALVRSSGYGCDPIMLIPEPTLEGAQAIHGKLVAPGLKFAHASRTRKPFELGFAESPFAR